MIIYGLVIIYVILLFCRYRNNFYLWRYLVKSSPCFEGIEKYVERFIEFYRKKKILINVVVFFAILVILMGSFIKSVFFHNLENIIRNVHENVMNIKSTVNHNNYKNINIKKNIEEIIKILFFLFLYCIEFSHYCIELSKKMIPFIKQIWDKVTLFLYKNSVGIIAFMLLMFCGIKTLDWFQKLNINLTVLFIQFCFIMYILYCLKIIILFTIKSIIKTILILLFFLFSMFLPMIGILILNYKDMNTTGIRVTKGNLETLKNRKIELFFKEGRKEFEIENKGNKLWIKNENDTEFKNSEIQKILFNKGNEGVLFMKKENKDENKNVEFVYINNENTKIKDKQNNEVEADVSIEGKIIIVKDSKIDENNIKNYIFINSWQDLNKIERIGIEEDNFYINLLNLVLFLFSILYFWLKLYGKKSSEYYDKKIINEIKNTPIILDRNKYDKFFTLSMFGLTIPNIWKTVSIKNIDEIRDQSSVYIKMFVFLLIFGVVLFCIITSKEISECVKELENKKPKRKRKN